MYTKTFMSAVALDAISELKKAGGKELHKVQEDKEPRFDVLKVYEVTKEVIDKVLDPNFVSYYIKEVEEATAFFENYFEEYDSIFFIEKENYRIKRSSYWYYDEERHYTSLDVMNTDALTEYFTNEDSAKSFCDEYFLEENQKRNLILKELDHARYGEYNDWQRIECRVDDLKELVGENEEALKLLKEISIISKRNYKFSMKKEEYIKSELNRKSNEYRYVIERGVNDTVVEVLTDKVSITNASFDEYCPVVRVYQTCVFCEDKLELIDYNDFGSTIQAVCTNKKCGKVHYLKPTK